MDIHVYLHGHHADTDKFCKILNLLEIIMATTQETLATVQGIKNQVTQIGVETQASLDKIIELEKLRDQAGETNQEVTAALEELKTMVTAVNDKIPDITQPA